MPMADAKYIRFALRIVGDFGATIAIPVVLGTWLGQKLDARTGHQYLYTGIGFALAALFTGLMIYRKTKRYGQEFQKL